ncbi:MAG: hypothetical protein IH840_07510 [Candidatus Heimdallarchaeota archaeon]|nr:hypothetical protein [Candidatus Heimdallarchaeota archaeon]
MITIVSLSNDVYHQKRIQKVIILAKNMTEANSGYDEDRERTKKFLRFAVILGILMVFWYGFNLADSF